MAVYVAGATGKIAAGNHFACDGNQGGPGGQIFASQSVVDGYHNLTFDVPSYAIAGSQDDILIAGRMQPDLLTAALIDIRTAWNSTATYATRIANIRAGVGVSLASLKATINVLDDAAADTLTGERELDWYFKAPQRNCCCSKMHRH